MNSGSPEAEPVITAIDDQTVRIYVKYVWSVICSTRRWGPLVVQYEFGVVGDPNDGPAAECRED